MPNTRKIMIVAGEASGDGHGAKVVRELRGLEPDTVFEFFGSAGPEMRDEGVDPTVHSDDLAIVGLAEIARALPMFLRAMKKLKAAALQQRPDAVVLIDFPDFNLKLAKFLKKKGLKVIYYISPQLWAWRRYRISTIRKYVDLLITVLPFEKGWYADRGVSHVEFVGSPLANEVHATRTKDKFCTDHGLDPAKPIISLLPGSRHKEIVRILPVLLESATLIAENKNDVQFVIALATPGHVKDVEELIAGSRAHGKRIPEEMRIVTGETYDAIAASDAAAVTSGTATLEAGIIGTPLAIVYKTSTLNYVLFKPLISVDHYGLINLIAGERIAKEIIQDDLSPEALANEMLRLLEPSVNAGIRDQLAAATSKLGQGGASRRAAEAILRSIDQA